MVRKTITAITVLFFTMLGLTLMASPAQATQPDPEHKVGICHRTASDSNPYVYIEVDEAAVPAHLGNTHPGHKPTTWKTDTVFRGELHLAGTAKDDYLAQSPEDCEDNTPLKPDPIDDVDRTVEERASCKAGIEERVTTTTTITDWVWVENEWQLGEPDVTVTVGDWTFVRDLTQKEQTEFGCNPVEPPCEEDQPCWDCETMGNQDCGHETPDSPDSDPQPKQQPKANKPELPHTGAGSSALLALIGTSLIGAGTWLSRRFS